MDLRYRERYSRSYYLTVSWKRNRCRSNVAVTVDEMRQDKIKNATVQLFHPRTVRGERFFRVVLFTAASSIMPTNRSRGGSSRAPRLDRDKNQKTTPDSGLKGAGGTDRSSRSKFEHIPSISRSSGVERDGDTYVHIRLCLNVPNIEDMQTKGPQRSRRIPKVLATEGNACWHMGTLGCAYCVNAQA